MESPHSWIPDGKFQEWHLFRPPGKEKVIKHVYQTLISGKPQAWSIKLKISLTSIFVDDPVKAHQFYTEVLGFQSKEFIPDAQLAIVVSPEDPNGTALLLEPQGDSFAKTYQENVYQAGLPIIVFGTDDIETTRRDLESRGVKFRDDLAKPQWGIQNLFDDTLGNLIMLHGQNVD